MAAPSRRCLVGSLLIWCALSQVATADKEDCALEGLPGNCRAAFRRYFYNAATKQCDGYIWGGCDDVEVPFESLEACKRDCMTWGDSPGGDPGGPRDGKAKDGKAKGDKPPCSGDASWCEARMSSLEPDHLKNACKRRDVHGACCETCSAARGDPGKYKAKDSDWDAKNLDPVAQAWLTTCPASTSGELLCGGSARGRENDCAGLSADLITSRCAGAGACCCDPDSNCKDNSDAIICCAPPPATKAPAAVEADDDDDEPASWVLIVLIVAGVLVLVLMLAVAFMYGRLRGGGQPGKGVIEVPANQVVEAQAVEVDSLEGKAP